MATKHIHVDNFNPSNRASRYDIDIFQCAYDEICIGLMNTSYHFGSSIQFDIPVKEQQGVAWKVNKASVSCASGRAEDVIDLLSGPNGQAYAKEAAQRLIFDHSTKSKTLGL